VKKAPFVVLIGANMPSILAEISFVSNPADAKKLRTPEYRQKIAESLYRGTAKYVSGLSGLKVASRGNKPGMVPVSAAAPSRSIPASSSNE
jgi:N-acetylmuramoyl-L-alanine amidase